jgi:hypothetical protein
LTWTGRAAWPASSPPPGRVARRFDSARALDAERAQAIEQVLVTGGTGCRGVRRARAVLEGLRQDMEFLDAESLPVVAKGSEVRTWTFAGGRANTIFVAGLAGQGYA